MCGYLLEYLWADDVLSYVEKEELTSERIHLRQTQKLLSLIAMKPAELFNNFLSALNLTGQAHVAKKLTENSTNGKEKLRYVVQLGRI